MNKTDFINRVLLIMNEAQMSDNKGFELVGADSAQIDKYIEGSYENAWRILANVVPKHWLELKQIKGRTTTETGTPITAPVSIIPFKGTGSTADYTIGTLVIPDDWYSLSRFKLDCWDKAVYETSYDDDRVASIQANPFTRGSRIRPVCVTSSEHVDIPSGSTYIDMGGQQRTASSVFRVMKYFTGTKTMPTVTGEYVKNITPLYSIQNDSTTLELSNEIIEPLSYVTAGCVFTILGHDTISKAITEKGMLMVPGYKRVRGDQVTYKQ